MQHYIVICGISVSAIFLDIKCVLISSQLFSGTFIITRLAQRDILTYIYSSNVPVCIIRFLSKLKLLTDVLKTRISNFIKIPLVVDEGYTLRHDKVNSRF
jgi:hypothetical protein